jgi:hypothetical protein
MRLLGGASAAPYRCPMTDGPDVGDLHIATVVVNVQENEFCVIDHAGL